MLLASWHTLRSSRLHLNRTLVACSHHHSLTLPPNDLLQNLRASHRHNYSVDSGTSTSSSVTFPIDVLDAQSSYRTFCALVEEGRLEEAKIVMRDAVEAAPTPAVISQFKQVLLDTPEKAGSLILDLAYILASKGERETVGHLLPVLRKVAGADALQELDALLSASSAPSQAETSESVFEDLSVDYENIRRTARAPKASIMELVQKKLPALLPEISANDEAIFEDDQEYTLTVQPGTSTENPLSSNHILLRLIEKNQLENAYHLLGELQELGTPIPKSPAYEAAVSASISDSNLSAKERASRVLAWLPLLPDKDISDTKSSYKILPIIQQLNRTKTTNVQLLADFSIVMAGKGYLSTLTYDIVPTVIRYSKFEFGRQFIGAVCNAATLFNEASSGDHTLEGPRMHIYSTAVRTLARNGRVEDAVTLLAEAAAASVRITKPTVDILISQLQKSNKTELVSRVEELVSEWRLNVASAPVSRAVRKSFKKLTSSLPVDLRTLKRGVALGTLPAPQDITNFMGDYLSTGRNIGLTMLLQKALNHSFFSSNVLLFSEMGLYKNMGQYGLIVETFVDHFHLTGIPREEVLALHRRLTKEREQRLASVSSPSPSFRVISRSRLVHPRGKLWPTVDHCDLVWAALAHYAESEKTLERLYLKLLRFAETGKDGLDDPASPSTASLMPPRPHSNTNEMVSNISFMPFIRPMMQAFGEERGVRILSDMVRLGLRPTVYHYTELAAFYSSKGMAEKTFLILDHMEQQQEKPKDPSTTASSQGALSSKPTSTSIYSFFAGQSGSLPGPDLTFYVAIIRGFIKSRDVEAATEVLRRLCRVHDYVPGEDSYLDTALVHLHELKIQGSTWVPKPY